MKLTLGVKVLVIVTCTLFSVIIAIVAGLLSHTSGAPVSEAVLCGGGAFAGCMILCLAVLTSLGVL
ncbi:hypothetical protein [Streptomyces caeruleatus]|uniref:Uncharacterized protein n=1 Tax=Streptomyces caeruleatus TaxID=661399 RepID=A0A101U5Q0_9ACTN|nr:hypothetical protein [Streptomyces caeruleatus]KUO04568.1 hypothetical protein AQJ67_10150 [Streptomyces caeruleatus]